MISDRWVRLQQENGGILAECAAPQGCWDWLREYLQTAVDLSPVLSSFPADKIMRQAIESCRGLRLLRQEPWECLASFICSSNKQITQIKQMISLICENFGERTPAPSGCGPVFAFPSPDKLARLSETGLRRCKLGFRAPFLLGAAKAVAGGKLDLRAVALMPYDEARSALMGLHGVGPKIADCVLLFGFGFEEAFPVDVWVRRVLEKLYFQGEIKRPEELRGFVRGHFGPHAGFAQQYLFHFARKSPAELFGKGKKGRAALGRKKQ